MWCWIQIENVCFLIANKKTCLLQVELLNNKDNVLRLIGVQGMSQPLSGKGLSVSVSPQTLTWLEHQAPDGATQNGRPVFCIVLNVKGGSILRVLHSLLYCAFFIIFLNYFCKLWRHVLPPFGRSLSQVVSAEKNGIELKGVSID